MSQHLFVGTIIAVRLHVYQLIPLTSSIDFYSTNPPGARVPSGSTRRHDKLIMGYFLRWLQHQVGAEARLGYGHPPRDTLRELILPGFCILISLSCLFTPDFEDMGFRGNGLMSPNGFWFLLPSRCSRVEFGCLFYYQTISNEI